MFLIADYAHLRTFEEKVCRISTVYIKVNLSTNFLKQNKVALENKLHLDFIEKHRFLFVLSCFMLFLRSEIVDLLVKLLVLLQVVLEFVNGLFCDFIELIFFLLDRSRFFNLRNNFFFTRSRDILFFNLHLFVINLFTQQLSRNFLLLLFQKTKYSVVVFINRWYWFVRWFLLSSSCLVLQNQHFSIPESLNLFLLQLLFLLLLFSRAILTEKWLLRYSLKWRVQTINMKSSVALVAYDKFVVIVIKIFHAYFTSHIFQSFIPLLSCNIRRL